MTLNYAFTAGTNAGLNGSVNLTRVGPTPTGCSVATPLAVSAVTANGLQGNAFALPAPVVSGGTPPYQFAFGNGGGGPPIGAVIDAASGVVSVPASAAVGFYSFSVCATDAAAQQACATVTATVNSAGPPSGLASSASLARRCATPRSASAIDPFTGQPYGDVQGSLDTEKSFLRSWINETYLWYADVPVVDPAPYVIGATVAYADPATNITSRLQLATNDDVTDAYFNSQRSPLFTASGKPKDQFHFTYATTDWVALATGGNVAGFGFQAAVLAGRPPRKVVVAYTQPGTPATANALARGAEFLTINGVDVINGSDVGTLNEALFNPTAGKQYTFTVLDIGAAASRTISMTATEISEIPVQNVHTLPAPNDHVGYMLFNDHIATAEAELITAVSQLRAANGGAGIGDLVLDIRYNGGGYLDIASELAYMIAGPAATAGKVFDSVTFNDKQSAMNTPTLFHNTAQGFSTAQGTPLPHLDLPRVFVITTGNTCSASESIMNGLRGIGIDVIQIGGTTCGKPYGFYAQENCSTTYFAIQFKGVNNVGFGDYADGFIPAGTGGQQNDLPGCAAADDYTHALGDTGEGLLATALAYRNSGSCPAPAAARATKATELQPAQTLVRSPLRENRLYVPPRR
jgi:C-terminal processing protease CtpA/Prc